MTLEFSPQMSIMVGLNNEPKGHKDTMTTNDNAVETKGNVDFFAMEEESLAHVLVSLVEMWQSKGFDYLDTFLCSLPASPFKKVTSLVIAASMADEIAEAGFEEFAKCSDQAGQRKVLVITYGSLLLYDKDEHARDDKRLALTL